VLAKGGAHGIVWSSPVYYAVIYAWKGGSVVNTVVLVSFVTLVVTVTLLMPYGLVAIAGAAEGRRHRAGLLVKLILPLIAVAVVALASTTSSSRRHRRPTSPRRISGSWSWAWPWGCSASTAGPGRMRRPRPPLG
jgi:hypothetical protein